MMPARRLPPHLKMSFKVIGADHTGITVSNLERALAFWRDVLGFEFSHGAHQKGERPEQITGVKGAELKLAVVKTPGGHHRVPVEALDEFLPASKSATGATRISGRNQLLGSVIEVKIEGLLAKVVLAVGSQRVTAIITADAVRELALKPGDEAVALIKATEVMIGRP